MFGCGQLMCVFAVDQVSVCGGTRHPMPRRKSMPPFNNLQRRNATPTKVPRLPASASDHAHKHNRCLSGGVVKASWGDVAAIVVNE